MGKRLWSCLVPLLLMTAAAAAHAAGPPNVEKLARDCRAGKAKECAKLLDVAMNATDEAVRLAAVAGLPDQKSLARAAMSPGPLAPRLAALERVTEPAALFEVADYQAFHGPDDVAVRLAAVARITDAAHLAKLVPRLDDQTALAAVGRLDDPAVLAEVYRTLLGKPDALKDYRPAIEAVLARMTDEILLEEIALSARETGLQRRAIDRIQDQARLVRIVKTHKDKYLAANVVKGLRDPALLADLATTAPEYDVRLSAISRIGDPALLAKIARGDPGVIPPGTGAYEINEARKAAIDGLLDRALLTTLARDAVVGTHATRRLNTLKASPPIEVRGVLIEPRLGIALGQERLELHDGNGRLLGETTTDAEGRFRFGSVLPAPWRLVGRTDSASLSPPKAGAGPLEVPFADDERVAKTFGDVCRSPRALEAMPAVPLLVLQQPAYAGGLAYQRAHWHPTLRTFAWDRAWKAVLCLSESSRLVGRYVDSAGRGSSNAYAVTWSVKVVRLQDGRAFEKSFAADPPDTARSFGGVTGDRSGDPSADVVAWLKTLE